MISGHPDTLIDVMHSMEIGDQRERRPRAGRSQRRADRLLRDAAQHHAPRHHQENLIQYAKIGTYQLARFAEFFNTLKATHEQRQRARSQALISITWREAASISPYESAS